MIGEVLRLAAVTPATGLIIEIRAYVFPKSPTSSRARRLRLTEGGYPLQPSIHGRLDKESANPIDKAVLIKKGRPVEITRVSRSLARRLLVVSPREWSRQAHRM